MLQEYRRQMGEAAERGDVDVVTELATKIKRLESSAPVTVEMLEGAWELKEVLDGGTRRGIGGGDGQWYGRFTFGPSQSYHREIRTAVGIDRRPTCGSDLVGVRSNQVPADRDEVVFVSGNYDLQGRDVRISDPWGGFSDRFVASELRARVLTLQEDGTLLMAQGSRCEWVFEKIVGGALPWAGERIDARKIVPPPPSAVGELGANRLCSDRLASSEDTALLALYALENGLLDDSPNWAALSGRFFDGTRKPLLALVIGYQCKPELVSRLLQAGLDPNVRIPLSGNVDAMPEESSVPLIEAVMGYRDFFARDFDADYEMAYVLLDHGADPNARYRSAARYTTGDEPYSLPVLYLAG